jgi:hypothetical protein
MRMNTKIYQMGKVGFSAVAVIFTAAITGCGGGGADAPGTGTPTVANAYPNVSPTVGDYWVYSETSTVVSGGNTAGTISYVRNFTASNPINRTDTFSNSDGLNNNNLSTKRVFDTAGKEINYKTGTSTCTYQPSFAAAPAFDTLAGVAFSANATLTCIDSVSNATTVQNVTSTGNTVGLEDVNVTAGTFKAFKYNVTRVTTTATNEGTANQTIWIDSVTGRTVKYTINTKSKTLPAGTLASEVNYVGEAVSYNAQGKGSVNINAKRFAGGWSGSYAGSLNGTCVFTVTAATSSNVTGRCTSSTNVNTTLTGSVNDAGAINITVSDGTALSGSLTSPIAGNGTWANGTATGTWTVTHK